jgi:hypothetical protein
MNAWANLHLLGQPNTFLAASNWTASISPWSEVSPEGKACQADVLSGKRQIANCAGQKGGAAACCGMLPIYYQYIKTPIFVSENTADKYQVEAQGGMPSKVGVDEAAYGPGHPGAVKRPQRFPV